MSQVPIIFSELMLAISSLVGGKLSGEVGIQTKRSSRTLSTFVGCSIVIIVVFGNFKGLKLKG